MRAHKLLAGALVALTAAGLVVTSAVTPTPEAKADSIDPIAYLLTQIVPTKTVDRKQLPDGSMQATLRVGPVKLRPHTHSGDHPHSGGADVGPMHGGMEPMHGTMTVALTSGSMVCSDCYVTSVKPEVYHADGRRADMNTGVMLHHSVFAQSGEMDPTCSAAVLGLLGRRFFASGNERSAGKMPEGYGQYFRKGLIGDLLGNTGIGAELEFMNMSDKEQVVYHDVTVTYVPGSKPGMKPVVPVWLDQDQCRLSQFAVPEGESHHRYEWTIPFSGTVKAVGGHLHDGGSTLTVSNGTTGQVMCDMKALYGTKPESMGHLDAISPVCVGQNVGTVKAGEKLRQDAVYHTHYADPGAMAISILYIAPN